MSLPVVRRYARTLNRPLSEVETVWRESKRQASEAGFKNDFPLILSEFRKRLGMHPAEGKTVYYEGAKSEVISETPAYALVRVLEIEKAPENVRPILEASSGLIVLNYTSLSDAQGNPLVETTGSVAVGTGTVQPLGGKSRFTYFSLDDLQKWSREGSGYLRKLWKSMSEDLPEKVKLRAFGEILRFEGRLEHISPGLVEDLATRFSTPTDALSKAPLTTTPAAQGVPPSTVVKKEEKPADGKGGFDDSDWNLILKKNEEPVDANDRNPLPDAPELKDAPEGAPKEKKPHSEPAPLSNSRQPSDSEIDALVGRIKGERKTIVVDREALSLQEAAVGNRSPSSGIVGTALEQRLKKRQKAWEAVT